MIFFKLEFKQFIAENREFRIQSYYSSFLFTQNYNNKRSQMMVCNSISK